MIRTLRPLRAGLTAAALLASLVAQSQRPVTADEIVELSPFVISTAALDGNRITEATAGTLVARPIDKLPMGLQVVSAEMMKELDIFNADGLNRLVAGLANQNQTSSEGTGNNTQYASRGFTVLPRRNGFAPVGRLYDMTGIDRVEVIRGPNSLLYGQSDAGGIINYITKRPRLRTTADARGIGQGDIKGIAGRILMHRNEARHAAALLVFAAHRVAGALRRDHDHVDGLLRLDQVEVHVEAVGEGDGRTVTDVRRDLVAVDVGLEFVGRRHHQQVGPLGGLGHGHDLQAVGLHLLGGGRTCLERNHEVGSAGILEVQRVGAALAAIADHGDRGALEGFAVDIFLRVNTHGCSS